MTPLLHHHLDQHGLASARGGASSPRRLSATRRSSCYATRRDRPEPVPVFQLTDRQHLTLDDVRDAYEVCSLIPCPDERGQCYSVFGLDANRMRDYYEPVLSMEKGLTLKAVAPHSMDESSDDSTSWLPGWASE